RRCYYSATPPDQRSFPTRRSSDLLLGELGRRIAEAVQEHEPEAALLAGPELGAVALAAAASLASELPFVIVRKEAKGYGTENRLDRKSTRLNSSHLGISYAVFCLK